MAFAFAVVSLLAAAGGLFSVLSYAVGGRRREFGIRVAMGAQASAVVPLAWLLSRAIMTSADTQNRHLVDTSKPTIN